MTKSKFKELILYVADKSLNDPTFGKTKLNKILFFTDFVFYRKWRKSITGQEYMKLQNGPAPRRMLPTLKEMERAGEILTKTTPYFNHDQQRIIALRPADLSIFDAEEISLVDGILDIFSEKNASQISEISHGFVGWQVAREKEVIPYRTAFLSDRELSPREFEYGIEVEQHLQ